MWSSSDTVKSDPLWGNVVSDLNGEATAVSEGKLYAALLDSIALIKVEGEDAETFLQGQVTCDIKAISQNQPKLGAHCNVKGRAQTTFVAFNAHNCFYLALKADQVEPTLAALKKYALFSKVTLSESKDFMVLGLGGSDIDQALTSAFGQCPEPDNSIVSANHTLINLPHLGYMAFVHPEHAEGTLNQLQTAHFTLCGDNAWQLAQVNSGLTLISQPLSEQWIPQEINYDLIGGVSFDKGCYKGQEIIARIHYRGQSKVRTHILELNYGTPSSRHVQLGDKVVSENQTGRILEVARVSERTLRVLCTLKTSVSESEELKLEQNDDCQIQVLPLPYAIT